MTSSLLSSSSSLLSLSLSLLLLLLALLCGNNKANAEEVTVVDSVDLNVDKYYNVNETRGEFEFRIQSYPIPIETTTYVDFVFNLPDDLPPLVHIVFGEAIISQPKHLHHFVLTGCTTKLDENLEEGKPLDRPSSDCVIPLGQWAPGSSVFGTSPDLSVGVAIGKAMGIQAVQLNVHYTDGEYENDDGSETYKIATDGIKVYYTPDLRDYTSIRKILIDVPLGPRELYIPPSTERYFLTKTCMVDTKCKDATDKQVQDFSSMWYDDTDTDMSDMLATMSSCPTMKPLCSSDLVQQLCPVSCGFCNNDDVNPRNPTSYRATSINYHAHLLGSEMYATLLREGGGGDDRNEDEEQEVLSSSTTNTTTTTNIIVKDLKSSEFWNFDYQESTAMDKEYEIQVGTSTTSDENENKNEEGIELVRGVEIKPGDKIQTTCVYNSMYREEKTRFGLSTYEEMCIIALEVTYKTPTIIADDNIDSGTAVDISLSADLMLRTFSCEVIDESTNTEDSSTPVLTDIWQGTLDTTEDPRNIWEDHPITTTDMCTFPVADYVLFQSMTFESRNCPSNDNNDYDHDSSSICYGFETDNGSGGGGGGGKIEFLDDTIAGYMCAGGTYDGRDSNEEPLYLTEENCLVDGGGTSYDAYTCVDIELWLQYTFEITNEEKEYMKENWWQPSCCREVIAAVIVEDGDVNDIDREDGVWPTSTAEKESSSSTYSSAFGYAIVVSFVIVMMAL